MTADDLVTIASFATAIEAELAQARLDSEGIFVHVAGEITASVMPYVAGANGVRLLVREQDRERALALLNETAEP